MLRGANRLFHPQTKRPILSRPNLPPADRTQSYPEELEWPRSRPTDSPTGARAEGYAGRLPNAPSLLPEAILCRHARVSRLEGKQSIPTVPSSVWRHACTNIKPELPGSGKKLVFQTALQKKRNSIRNQ